MTGVRERLGRMIERNHLPHGLVFLGSDKSDRRGSAIWLAQSLLCSSQSPLKPCGVCDSCVRVAEGNHPDAMLLAPEKQEFTIDQVRELQRWIYLGPFEASRKVAILDRADQLNAAASNALLKMLEEPPPYATLILLAQLADNLLPTVLSRLMSLRFPEIGSPASESAPLPNWMDPLKEFLSRGDPASPDEVFALTTLIGKDKEELPLFFEAVERHLRDSLSGPALSATHARRYERLFDLTLKAEQQTLRRYANVSLLLDQLLLEWSPSSA